MTTISKSKTSIVADQGSATATAPKAPTPPATNSDSKDKPNAPDNPSYAEAASAPKAPSKADQLAAMVIRDEGATLDQMVAALGWLPHTTRAALTGLKKKGFAISSDKVDGVRTYRAVAPE